MMTTRTIIPINNSKLNEIIGNASKFEHDLIFTFARYLFIKCERIEFKKTGCRLKFNRFKIPKLTIFRQDHNLTQKTRLASRNVSLISEDEINICEKGYRGLLCSGCDRKNKYYKAGLFVCRKCPDHNILSFASRMIFIIFWLLLFSL